MKINEEKLQKVFSLQKEIRERYEAKAYMILLANSVLPKNGITGFFMRKYKERLNKAEDSFYNAGSKVLLGFQINPYGSLTICYEGRPISTKEEFVYCKKKYLQQIAEFENTSEWLEVKEIESFDRTVSEFLKKLEEVFEEDEEE